MFQDYTSKVIKTIDVISAFTNLKTTTNDSVGINKIQRAALGGKNGCARQIQFDSNNTNVLFSFDGSIFGSEGNDFVAFVHTYAATAPLDGDFVIPNNNVSIIPFLSIQGSGYFQGNVLIPRLELATNEKQYIMAGVASITGKTANVPMYIDMKLHLEDKQVFQPSK
ncbi:hypothetical protein [Vibrio phage vB_VpP_WS0699]